jgi:galactokinase
VPIGAGLSSSAALTVSVARALTGLAGRRVPPETLAEVAYHAEHDEVGVKCGRMDQTISALARRGYALLFETATARLEHVPLPSRVWVFETGVAHRLTGGELNTRRRECEEALKLVARRGPAPRTLADVPYDDLATLVRELPPPFSLRLRHVVTETDRTRRAAAALARRDLVTAGTLLVAGHASLRDDYQSSCPEADLLVDALVRHGAYGARLTGAGWGGAVIALAPEASERGMLTAVQAEYREAFGRLPAAWVTKAAAGVRSEK